MPEPLKMVYEQDAPLDAIKGKTVAVIGFGSQGHAHAQNLRDSGIKVIVANRKDSPNGRLAVEKGFNPTSVEEAVKAGDVWIEILEHGFSDGWSSARVEFDAAFRSPRTARRLQKRKKRRELSSRGRGQLRD